MKNIIRKKAYVNEEYCVACGMCQKNCPVKAISVYKGINAVVDTDKCIGCAKCSRVCPASVIEMK